MGNPKNVSSTKGRRSAGKKWRRQSKEALKQHLRGHKPTKPLSAKPAKPKKNKLLIKYSPTKKGAL